MKITLLHPSRGRSLKAFETMVDWLSKTSKDFVVEHILSVDSDDELLPEYVKLFRWSSKIIINTNKNLIQATNEAAKTLTGDIIVLLSDDFECYKNWDHDLVKVFSERKGCILKTFDGVQKWIVTLPIMDREYYLAQGYVYYPEYTHMFCDTDMTHKADIEGKLIVRNDLLFKHAHYSTGATQKDAVNTKADSTWAQGEAVYLKRVKQNFGLDPTVDILNINAEGNPHKNWLKNKLSK